MVKAMGVGALEWLVEPCGGILRPLSLVVITQVVVWFFCIPTNRWQTCKKHTTLDAHTTVPVGHKDDFISVYASNVVLASPWGQRPNPIPQANYLSSQGHSAFAALDTVSM